MKNFLRYKKKGVTLVEIMMVVAVMGVLFLGVFSLLNKVTKGTWRISGTLGMTDAASEAMYWIGNDFRNAKASSMGNYAPNPGFEEPYNPNSIDGWESLAVNPVAQKLYPSSGVQKNGFSLLNLTNGPTSYFSNNFVLPWSKRYLMAGWLCTGGDSSIELRDSLNNMMVTFSTPGLTNPYWIHLATITAPLAAATTSYLKLGTTYIFCQPQIIDWSWGFNSRLQMGSDDAPRIAIYLPILGWALPGSIIYKYRVGNIWQLLPNSLVGICHPCNAWSSEFEMVLDSSNRPHITAHTAGPQIKIVYTSWNGANWTAPVSLYTFPVGYTYDTYSTIALDANNKPHVFWTEQIDAVNINIMHTYFNGVGWVPVETIDTSNAGIIASTPRPVFDSLNDLHVIYKKGFNIRYQVWNNSIGWTVMPDLIIAGGTFKFLGRATVMDNNYHPHITYSVNVGGINKLVHAYWNGTIWIQEDVASGLPICNYISSLDLDSNDYPHIIYVDSNDVYFTRWNGTAWIAPMLVASNSWGTIGCPDIKVDSKGINHMSFNRFGGGVGYLRNSYCYFDDISVAPTEVIFSSSTAVSMDTDYEYYTAKGTDMEDIKRFKRYRLHYDQSVRKLYRQKYTGPGPNDWQNESPAPLCENVSRLTITNNNQESFDVELILEKVIDASQTKEYRVKSRFTPAVP